MIRWLPFLFIPLVAWVKDATVAVLITGAIVVLAQADTRRAALAPPRFAPVVLAFALFAAWTLVSFAWASAFPAANWTKAFLAIGLIALLGRGVDAVPSAGRGLIAAWAALFAVLVVERLTGGAILGLVRVGDSPDRNFDTLSPGLAFLTCLSYPVAALVWQRYRRLWQPIALVVAAFALGVTYRMDAAPIALLIGAVAFLCVWIAGRFGYAAVLGALALAAVAWGTLSTLAVNNDLPGWITQHATRNWGLRVEIWHRADELIHARPLLGYGFDAARTVDETKVIPIHTHNGLLQIWLELGAVGVMLFLVWCALGAQALQHRAQDRAALAVTLATALVISVFWEVSFGIWQGWWLSAIGLTFIALRVAVGSWGRR